MRIATPAQSIRSLAFSPDGRVLASACPNQPIRLWDPATGQQISKLEAGTDLYCRLVFSPSGSTLAAFAVRAQGQTQICQHDVVLWDVATGKTRRLEGYRHTGFHFSDVAFSPDGRTLASTEDDRTVFLWDFVTAKQIGRITGPLGGFSTLVFSPDGKMLASSGGNCTINLWEVPSGKAIRSEVGTDGPVQALAVSPDGKLVACGGWLDQAIHLWEADTGRELGQLTGPERTTHSLAFSPDGTLLASGDHLPFIRLWNVQTRRETKQFLSHETGGIYSLLFSPGGKTLTSQGGSSEVRLTEIASGKVLWKLDPPGGSCSLASLPMAGPWR